MASSAAAVVEDDGLQGLIDGEIEFGDLELIKPPIGKGQFGEVYKALLLGTDVCVKRMFNAEQADARKYIAREVKVLQAVHHPNVLQFIGVCNHEKDIYLVTEFIPGGDLRKLLKSGKPLKWSTRVHIALDIAKALAYLHSRHIMHRDLKSKNLLIDNSGAQIKVKICDFGLARSHQLSRQQRAMTMCGTDEWMAPEVILGMDYDTKCDVFSYGIVLCEIITRRKPNQETFARNPQLAFGLDFEELRALAPKDCPKAFLQMAFSTCEYEPELRPDMREVVFQLKEQVEVVVDDESREEKEHQVQQQQQQLAKEKEEQQKQAQAQAEAQAQAQALAQAQAALQQLQQQQQQAQQQPGKPQQPQQQPPPPQQQQQQQQNNHPQHLRDLPKRMTAAQLQDMFVQEMNSSSAQRLMKLIERATHETYPDTEWCHTILLTMPAFAKPKEVLEKLIIRFNGDEWKPEVASDKKVSKIIRLRVLNLIRIWLDNYFVDFVDDPSLKDMLFAFVDTAVVNAGLTNAAQNLRQSFELRKTHFATTQAARSAAAPKAVMTVNRASSVLNFTAEDVAQGLTLFTFDTYRYVAGRDLLRFTTRQGTFPTLTALMQLSARISAWVASDILQTPELAKRQKLISHFLNIGSLCLSYQNFVSALDIACGLTCAPIQRLEKTMKGLDKKEIGNLKSLTVLKDQAIMEKIVSAPYKPPRIPPFDVFLRQLETIHASNTTVLANEEVNTDKLRLINAVIQKITENQHLEYHFEAKEVMNNFFTSLSPLPEDRLVQLSKSVEP